MGSLLRLPNKHSITEAAVVTQRYNIPLSQYYVLEVTTKDLLLVKDLHNKNITDASNGSKSELSGLHDILKHLQSLLVGSLSYNFAHRLPIEEGLTLSKVPYDVMDYWDPFTEIRLESVHWRSSMSYIEPSLIIESDDIPHVSHLIVKPIYIVVQ